MRRRRAVGRLVALPAVVGVVAVAGTVLALGAAGSASEEPAVVGSPASGGGGGTDGGTTGGTDGGTEGGTDGGTATAEVAVRDLVLLDELEGEVSFGETRDVVAGRDGVVTAVAGTGTAVGAGGVLLEVGAEPTVVLRGDVPAYRELADGDVGEDVTQLEEALVDLGHGDALTVDDEFTAATADALQAWEEDLGRADPDGVLALGDVVFVPVELRVDEVVAGPGTAVQSGTTVLRVTSTERVVDLAVTTAVADRLEAGTPASLVLPDGTATTGTVTTVAGRAESDPATGEETVAVTVSPDDPAALAAWDTGAVEVGVERSRTSAATAVPVEALLALAEGGYAVEVVADDGSTRLVAVEVGTVADGWVALEGGAVADGTLADGTTVVVAS